MKFIPVLISLLLAACQKPAEPPVPVRPALVEIVGERSAESKMVLVGEVRSRYESNQGFRVAGKIINRKVEIGSMVKKGQALASLDAADAGLANQVTHADVQAAQADYALANSELQRYRQLFQKEYVSASALDAHEAQFKTAAARLAQAQAQASVSSNLSRYTVLTADRDGVVTSIQAEPGQVVAAGEVVAKIADTKYLEVQVAVPESRMNKVQAGEKVTIKLWAQNDKSYAGRVREIAPAADSATRAFNVRVSFIDADNSVKLGMTTAVHFFDTLSDGIYVPLSALTERQAHKMVWVIDAKNKATARMVEASDFSENGVRITQGLKAGETIAVAGVHTLIEGMQVKPRLTSAQLEVLP